MPAIARILETALYVDDMDAAVTFYRDVMGLRAIESGPRLVAMHGGQSTLLLLFKRGASASGVNTPEGRIPPHDGQGPVHVAFAIDADALETWESHLRSRGVAIESRIDWDRGGKSIYFRDPDGHSLELVTPNTWAVY